MRIENPNNNSTIAKNAETFEGSIYSVWGDMIDLSNSTFSGLSKDITVTCTHGETFTIKASNLLKSQSKCTQCNNDTFKISKTESATELILNSKFYMKYVGRIMNTFNLDEEISINIFKMILLAERSPLNVLASRMMKLFVIDRDKDEATEKEKLFKMIGKMILEFEEIDVIELEKSVYNTFDYELMTPSFETVYNVVSVAQMDNKMLLTKYPAPLLSPAEDYDYDTNMSGSRHAIMGDEQNQHSDSQRLDLLNRLQKIPFTLHPISENFVPSCPTDDDPYKRVKKVNAWEIFNRTYGITKKIISSKLFYYPFKLDKRGRSYCAAYALNLQGSEFQKASVEFANKEIVNVDDSTISDTSKTIKFENMSPFDILLVTFANHYGLDKENWNTRLDWAISNLDAFKSCEYHKEPLKSMFKEAEEPILLKKAIMSYRIALKGEPIGLQCYFDATASFSQIASVLIGDEKEMEICNVIANDRNERMDLYLKVSEGFETKWFIKEPKANGLRKAVKKPIMTTGYNSKKVPEETFKEEYLDNFYNELKNKLPATTKLRELINRCYGRGRTFHEMTLPDGHIAYMPSMKSITKMVKIDGLDAKVEFTTKIVAPNAMNARSLAPNNTHGWDGWIVEEMSDMADGQGFEMYSIHDSFSCGLNHAVKMMKNYRIILAKMYMNKYLENTVKQLSNGRVMYRAGHRSERVRDLILSSQYALS